MGGINSLVCQSPDTALRYVFDSPRHRTEHSRGLLYAYRPNRLVGRWVTLLMWRQKKMPTGARSPCRQLVGKYVIQSLQKRKIKAEMNINVAIANTFYFVSSSAGWRPVRAPRRDRDIPYLMQFNPKCFLTSFEVLFEPSRLIASGEGQRMAFAILRHPCDSGLYSFHTLSIFSLLLVSILYSF